ncbi:outer membrane beta-barrel protein [bacterium]|nr:outer membrane beta-barrel protein [bacterium]
MLLRWIFILCAVLVRAPLFADASLFPRRGLYFEGTVGAGFGSASMLTDAGSVTSTSYFDSTANTAAVNRSGTGVVNSNHFTFGAKAGKDWLHKSLVWGLVSDLSLFKQTAVLDASGTYPSGGGGYSLRTVVNTNWLLTLRGRAGLPVRIFAQGIFYATAGLAFADLNIESTFIDDTELTGSGTNELAGTQLGWTVGGGFEFEMDRDFSLNAEYLYADFSGAVSGSIANSAAGFGTPANSLSSTFTSRADFHSHVVRVGVVYRFNGAADAETTEGEKKPD